MIDRANIELPAPLTRHEIQQWKWRNMRRAVWVKNAGNGGTGTRVDPDFDDVTDYIVRHIDNT